MKTKTNPMKNYLVIGGSRGIGKEICSILISNDDAVHATYNSTEPPPDNDLLKFHKCNVLDEALSFDYLPETLDGIAYLPGSINLRPFARIKPEEFAEDFRLQAGGAVKVIQTVLPRLKKSANASIVLFSTVAVQTGFSFHAQVAASKGAVEGLMRSLAAELAPTIRVNCIAPSLTDTPLANALLNSEEKKSAAAQRHPLKKYGRAGDIANMAVFLLSEKSSWITGQVIHVDGGISSIR